MRRCVGKRKKKVKSQLDLAFLSSGQAASLSIFATFGRKKEKKLSHYSSPFRTRFSEFLYSSPFETWFSGVHCNKMQNFWRRRGRATHRGQSRMSWVATTLAFGAHFLNSFTPLFFFRFFCSLVNSSLGSRSPWKPFFLERPCWPWDRRKQLLEGRQTASST